RRFGRRAGRLPGWQACQEGRAARRTRLSLARRVLPGGVSFVAHATNEEHRMDERVRRSLTHGHTIDITTTGRRTGESRRIEIVFHNFDGRLYITGMHRTETRAWLHNLAADPHFTFHLKGPVSADLPATARVITDDAE